MRLEIFLSFFPFDFTSSDLSLLAVFLGKLGDDSERFEDYLYECRITYKELFEELKRSINGLGNSPSFRVRGIIPYMKPPIELENVPVHQVRSLQNIVDLLHIFQDKMEVYRVFRIKDPKIIAPVFNSGGIIGSQQQSSSVSPLPTSYLEPVHGPYSSDEYNKPVFVQAYDLRIHKQRVSDIFEILYGVSGQIVSLGDGAGTCFEACIQLRAIGHNITCRSYDNSDEMIAQAHRCGNDVLKGDFSVPILDDEILFLSHVCDYYPQDFLFNHRNCRIISFERVTSFPGCHWLVPYRKEWGYALATRNYRLENVVLSCIMQIVSPLDFTMVTVAQELFVRHITVAYDVPEYITLIDTVNSQLDVCPAHSKAHDNAVISCRVHETTCQGIPYLGVVTNQTASRLGSLTTGPVLDFFKSFGGVFPVRARFVPKVFAVTVDNVYTASSGLHHRLHTSLRGDFRICRVPNGVSAVVIRDCICCNQAPHDHALIVIFKSAVVIENINYDINLQGFSPTPLAQRAYVLKNYVGPGNSEQYYNNLSSSNKLIKSIF